MINKRMKNGLVGINNWFRGMSKTNLSGANCGEQSFRNESGSAGIGGGAGISNAGYAKRFIRIVNGNTQPLEPYNRNFSLVFNAQKWIVNWFTNQNGTPVISGNNLIQKNKVLSAYETFRGRVVNQPPPNQNPNTVNPLSHYVEYLVELSPNLYGVFTAYRECDSRLSTQQITPL